MSERRIYVAFMDAFDDPAQAAAVWSWNEWDEENVSRDELVQEARKHAVQAYGEDAAENDLRVAEITLDGDAIARLFFPNPINGTIAEEQQQ